MWLQAEWSCDAAVLGNQMGDFADGWGLQVLTPGATSAPLPGQSGEAKAAL